MVIGRPDPAPTAYRADDGSRPRRGRAGADLALLVLTMLLVAVTAAEIVVALHLWVP
jgi:hypothetical protein